MRMFLCQGRSEMCPRDAPRMPYDTATRTRARVLCSLSGASPGLLWELLCAHFGASCAGPTAARLGAADAFMICLLFFQGHSAKRRRRWTTERKLSAKNDHTVFRIHSSNALPALATTGFRFCCKADETIICVWPTGVRHLSLKSQDNIIKLCKFNNIDQNLLVFI